MTFTDFESFVEWIHDSVESVPIQEENPPGDDTNWVAIERLESADPLELTEVLLSAYDSGFYLGAFNSRRYGGTLTIYE